MNLIYLKTPPSSDQQPMLDLYPILPYQHFGFNEELYKSYSQKPWTICEITNIFYLVSSDAIKVLLLQAVVVQVNLMLL